MPAPILIISSVADTHTDLVVRELNRRGEPVIRWHVDELLKDQEISSDSDGFSVRLSSSQRAFHSRELRSVWYRRPESIYIDEQEFSDVDRTFAAAENYEFLCGLYESIDALWVSLPSSIRKARYKINQLAVARHMGLQIPETLVSNKQEELVRFASNFELIVLKPIAASGLCFDSGEHSYYSKLRARDFEFVAGIQQRDIISPILIQEAITNKLDVRLTAIGRELRAVSIQHFAADEYDIDCRQELDKKIHQHIDIPAQIAEACIKYLEHFGLNYGAFDFAVASNGRWLFLECNPNGQFLWLEPPSGVPLCGLMCDLLTGHGNPVVSASAQAAGHDLLESAAANAAPAAARLPR